MAGFALVQPGLAAAAKPPALQPVEREQRPLNAANLCKREVAPILALVCGELLQHDRRRDLRRLESVSLSPAFAGFDELLRGLPHVRAFGMEERYQDRFYQRVDRFQSFDHVYVRLSLFLNISFQCTRD